MLVNINKATLNYHVKWKSVAFQFNCNPIHAFNGNIFFYETDWVFSAYKNVTYRDLTCKRVTRIRTDSTTLTQISKRDTRSSANFFSLTCVIGATSGMFSCPVKQWAPAIDLVTYEWHATFLLAESKIGFLMFFFATLKNGVPSRFNCLEVSEKP